MTLLETVVVVLVLLTLTAILLPPLMNQPNHRHYSDCTNNLKQIGLAARIWAGDNNDKYPMAVSVTNGGAMEAVALGDAMTVFQVMSNELSTPKILVCSEDKQRDSATNFNPLTSGNVSYFVNRDAVQAEPWGVMSGDDNFEIAGVPVKSGRLNVSTNSPLTWSAARHKSSGNLTLADGSVQSAYNSQLKNWFWPTNDGLSPTNFTTIRLAIP